MKFSLIFVLAFIAFRAEAELTKEQKKRCEQFISVFENDSIDIKYDFVEDIHDGRGYTCGKFGFTTATGDAYELIKEYTAQKKTNPLAKYLPELQKLAKTMSKDTTHLKGFATAWKEAAKDPLFLDTQDVVSARMSYNPAMKWADKAKLKSALGRCALYDCIIEHGDGDDGDSIGAIFNRTLKQEKGPVQDDEEKWVKAFLNMRLDDFDHPRDALNKAHAKGWHDDSVERVYAMQALLSEHNMDLKGPIHIKTKYHKATIP